MLWPNTEIYDRNENFPYSPVPYIIVVPWNYLHTFIPMAA